MLSIFRICMLGVVTISTVIAGWRSLPLDQVIFYAAVSLTLIWLAQSREGLRRRVSRVRAVFAKDLYGAFLLIGLVIFLFYIMLPAGLYSLGYGSHQLLRGLGL